VKPENDDQYVDAGADMLAVGTGIYHAPDAAKAVASLVEEPAGLMRSAGRFAAEEGEAAAAAVGRCDGIEGGRARLRTPLGRC
jgi:hypothetical protein